MHWAEFTIRLAATSLSNGLPGPKSCRSAAPETTPGHRIPTPASRYLTLDPDQGNRVLTGSALPQSVIPAKAGIKGFPAPDCPRWAVLTGLHSAHSLEFPATGFPLSRE